MLPYGRQTIDEADIAAVEAVLRSDFLTTGPQVAGFEADFAALRPHDQVPGADLRRRLSQRSFQWSSWRHPRDEKHHHRRPDQHGSRRHFVEGEQLTVLEVGRVDAPDLGRLETHEVDGLAAVAIDDALRHAGREGLGP